MSIEDRAKATAKNIEGKAQEFVGDVTGNTEDKAEGKAKQAEANVRHGVENVKDDVKRAIDQCSFLVLSLVQMEGLDYSDPSLFLTFTTFFHYIKSY